MKSITVVCLIVSLIGFSAINTQAQEKKDSVEKKKKENITKRAFKEGMKFISTTPKAERQRASSDAFLPSLNRGLALAALLLAALTGTLGLMAMDRKLTALEKESAAVRAEASSVLALQREALARVEAIRLIERRTASPLRFSVLLDAVADAIPQDSWLEGFAYDGKQISLVGLSRSSDSLVSNLEAIPGVTSARVVSSMARDNRLNADRFRIELMLEQDDVAPPALASEKEDNG